MSKETAGELLPCPFCGSTAEFGRVNDAEMGDFGGEFIQCTNHGCATSSMLINVHTSDTEGGSCD